MPHLALHQPIIADKLRSFMLKYPNVEEDSYYDRWEFESRGKTFRVHVKGSLILNDPLLMIQESIKGVGLSYITEDSIQRELNNGQLELVLEKYSCSSEDYYLYYPSRTQVMPKLRALIEHLQ